ncbi:MAG: molecular chaperone [Clostridia bacterium]|nr:molecular chaperone [Clostridia bacterium]
MIEVFNRYEKKFLIDTKTYQSIKNKLLNHMEFDSHNRNHEFYTISNIYYDTSDNHLIRNSLSKPKYKEKLRLRAYGIPEGNKKVYLEIKKKVCGLVNKRRTALRLNEAYEFINTGIKPEIKEYMNGQVINEIEYFLKLYMLEPKLYLAYDRIGMFGKENHDLRITFDTNIRTRRNDLRLESGDFGEQLLENGQWLMEVKAEKSVPIWLSQMLSDYKVYSTSFSKYGKVHQKTLLEDLKLKGDLELCSKQYSTQQQLASHYLYQVQY